MDPQNNLYSLLAVFLALGIGTLVGATIGENALVINQLEVIDKLQDELYSSRIKIQDYNLKITELEEELKDWEYVEEEYLNPVMLENQLKNTYINVIVHGDSRPPALKEFLEMTGCHLKFFNLVNENNNFLLKQIEDYRASYLIDNDYPQKPNIYIINWCKNSSFYRSFISQKENEEDLTVWITYDIFEEYYPNFFNNVNSKVQLSGDIETFAERLKLLKSFKKVKDN